jgi:hypothetical protein
MLDVCVSQAAGLSGLARHNPPRLVAVVSHGQQQGELPLLWSLCSTWVDMGLSVVVLDGHSRESNSNPGLLQMLAASQRYGQDDPEPSPWSVLPAAMGLERLKNSGHDWQTVGTLFPDFGVVLVYADAPCLTNLLHGSGLAPLLVVPPLKAASLTAYQALKKLLLDAGLEPTVANIHLPPVHPQSLAAPDKTLHACAQSFLGLTLHPLSLTAMANSDQSSEEINRLARHLLENAVMLETHPADRTH